MSGFNLSTIRFNPFSYRDYVAPIETYQKAYDQAQATQDALDAAATEYQDTIMQNPDSAEAQAYKSYMQGLNDAATTFSKYGLEGISTDDLYNMKKNYNHNIAPIVKAAKLYENLQGKAAEARQKGLYVSTLPTLGDLRKDYGASFKTASPDAFYKAGAAAAQAYGSQFSDAQISALSGNIGDWYQKITQSQGLSGADAMRMLRDSSNPLAQSLYQYLDAQGMGEGSNYSKQDIAEAANQFRSGVFAGSNLTSKTSIQERADNPIAQQQQDNEETKGKYIPFTAYTQMLNAGYNPTGKENLYDPRTFTGTWTSVADRARINAGGKNVGTSTQQRNDYENQKIAANLDSEAGGEYQVIDPQTGQIKTVTEKFLPQRVVVSDGTDTQGGKIVVGMIDPNLGYQRYDADPWGGGNSVRHFVKNSNFKFYIDGKGRSGIYAVPQSVYIQNPNSHEAAVYRQLLQEAGVAGGTDDNYYLFAQLRLPSGSIAPKNQEDLNSYKKFKSYDDNNKYMTYYLVRIPTTTDIQTAQKNQKK